MNFLAKMQYDNFSKKVVSVSSLVTPEHLPPPMPLENFILVEFTIISDLTWIGKAEGMDAMDWGRSLQDNHIVPVMSTMDAAPDILSKVTHCNCLNSCNTLRCSCRKNRLPCISACGHCQVAKCNNPHNKIPMEEHGGEHD